MVERPFIHLLKSPYGYYFYDVNRNEIVMTSSEIYDILRNILDCDEGTYLKYKALPQIQSMIDMGYLSEKRPLEIHHPKTNFLEDMLNNKIGKVTLQLTQNCNFRCTYCNYSNPDRDRQRVHHDASMPLETALKAVDFLNAHSRYSNNVDIGFYGGEPLLAFDTLKKVVSYADDVFDGRDLSYSMTTNGSIFTDEIVCYCMEHNISVLVSLDGPKELHDRNRRFAATGGGTFDLVIRNMDWIGEKYPEFMDKIRFNMVIDPTADYDCYNQLHLDYHQFDRDRMRATLVDTDLGGVEYPITESFIQRSQYNQFLSILNYFGRVTSQHTSDLSINWMERLEQDSRRMLPTSTLPDTIAPGGPCLPGVLRALVDVYGNLFPCERCSETSPIMMIGSLEKGFDIEKAKALLNVGAVSANACRNCWALLHCTLCASRAEDGAKLSPEKKMEYCWGIRVAAENKLRGIIMLRELEGARKQTGGRENA